METNGIITVISVIIEIARKGGSETNPPSDCTSAESFHPFATAYNVAFPGPLLLVTIILLIAALRLPNDRGARRRCQIWVVG